MAENGTCVVGPSLPVTFTPGNEECVMLDVSATIEANLLFILIQFTTILCEIILASKPHLCDLIH
jgi:hypothetical protein